MPELFGPCVATQDLLRSDLAIVLAHYDCCECINCVQVEGAVITRGGYKTDQFIFRSCKTSKHPTRYLDSELKPVTAKHTQEKCLKN